MKVTNKTLDAILDSWDSANPIEPKHLMTGNVLAGVTLFLIASSQQGACHRHLASLKKYTLPHEGLFKYIVCPHYTCECLLYLGIAISAAPAGLLWNQTCLCGLLFVATNLGTTAHGTAQWYAARFGHDRVSRKWSMLPPVF
jgi:3-oxo-5-alpha-steroid 4-dehydrogenase 3